MSSNATSKALATSRASLILVGADATALASLAPSDILKLGRLQWVD